MSEAKYYILRRFVLCILPILLFSCKHEYRLADRSALFLPNLDNTTGSEFKYSELYGKVTAISFSNKEVTLAEINKLLVHNDLLYVSDRKSQAVYAFRKDGSFVRKFGNPGAGPHEYAGCKDFAINADAGEVYIYDAVKNQIHKYDISSGAYKASIPVDKSIHIDYITCNSGDLYAAQTSNRNEQPEETYYLLYQIDTESGKKTAQWFDAASYNKGWNDEFIHSNLFYNITEDEDLFVLGLMDTIMCIKKNEITPFLAIESERLVQKEDIPEEDRTPTSNPMARSRQMMSLLTRLSAGNKLFHISNVFEYNSMLYFNCMGRSGYFVRFDEKNQAASIYSRITNDVLFQKVPDHFQLPVFLSADDSGVYYYVSNEQLSELKHFIEQNNISEELINSKSIKESTDDSNPIILYYEYKE